jgi:Flp pilus assembly protein TadD
MSSPAQFNDNSRRGVSGSLAALVLALLPLGAWGHGPLHERIAALTAEVAAKPDDVTLRYQLAEICFQHGDWDASLKNLERVEQLAPGQFPTDLLRGRAALSAGKADDAKAALDRFIAGQPGNSQALYLRARAFERLGKNDECLNDYRAALAVDARPEPDVFQEVAVALAFRGHKDEALRVLDAGMAKLGAIPTLGLKAIEMEVSLKRYDAALLRLEAMQKAAPRPEPWMAKRAALLEQAGRPDESRAAWESLVTHLSALPEAERRSHAMSKFAEQSKLALEKLPKRTITSPSSL